MPISRTEFSSGLRVVTERMPGIRSVSIGFWVLAGSRDERPAISGHCHFLEHLLFKGTATRTALDIAEAFDAVGGDVNAFTAKEYTCYYARVLDRDLSWRSTISPTCSSTRRSARATSRRSAT
jgi:predicted Zn-dependent peptidase